MFDLFVSYSFASILLLALWSYALSFSYVYSDDVEDPAGCACALYVIGWIVLGFISLVGSALVGGTYVVDGAIFFQVSFVGVSCSIVFYVNILLTCVFVGAYLWEKFDGAERYKKYRDQCEIKKGKDKVLETAQKICRKIQLPTKAKSELDKALKEWKILNKEIVPATKLWENSKAALAKVERVYQAALLNQKKTKNKELLDSYANTAQELAGQCGELRKSVDFFLQQVEEKNARINELFHLFQQAEKDAEEYKAYEAFTTNAMAVQKELKEKWKEEFLKVKKTK
jgi:hypothetical protein